MSFWTFFLGEFTTDEALDGVKRVLGIGHGLALGRCANQYFATVLVGDDGWCGARTFRVLDHFGRVAFHDGHAAVGGAEVNADNSSHDFLQSSNLLKMFVTCG